MIAINFVLGVENNYIHNKARDGIISKHQRYNRWPLEKIK